MTEAPVTLPWRRRAPRVKPDGFVAPRFRRANGAGDAVSELAAPVDASRSERVPFNRIQARAAVALVDSKQRSAHAHTLVACDYSAVDEARGAHGAAFRAAEGFSLTNLPFVSFAVCRALAEHPALNATTVDDGVVLHRRVALGIAVDLAHQGLVVPAVKDADSLSVRGLARAVHDLATRARAKQLKPDDVAGGTFTITNPGGYGTYRSFPIINQPQVAILATDGVRRAVVADDRGRLDVRPVGHLCLSFDQRVVDVAAAAAFLAAVREILETHNWSALV